VLAVFEDWAGDGAGNGGSTRSTSLRATQLLLVLLRRRLIPIRHIPPPNHSTHTKIGFGTLYAYQNAVAKARALYDGFDLHAALLDKEVSVGLYHTAGKGTRCVGLEGETHLYAYV
jgi:hypothetical protein